MTDFALLMVAAVLLLTYLKGYEDGAKEKP